MKDERGARAWLRRVSAAGGDVVLELGGEVDLSSTASINSVLEEVLAAQPASLTFELRQLRFMDSSGIALLVSAAQRVERLELRYPSATVRRVIELSGLSATLPITS